MVKRTLLLAIGFWLLISGGFAQQLPLSNQYTINKFFLSPAYAGVSGGLEIFGTYRNEWADIPGAPETKSILANGMVANNMGLGGSVSSYTAGIFENISASASYAYHLKLGAGQYLSFGLGVGLLESRVNIAGNAGQTNDPVAVHNMDVSDLVMDASFGILYRMKDLHAGIALPRLLSSKIKNELGTAVYSLAMQQGFNIGYRYAINNDWIIDPVAKVSLVKNAPVYYDVAVPVIYKKVVWLFPIYKKTDIAIGIGGIPYSNLIVQYAYEFSSKGIMGESGGTHEITIGWRMQQKKKSEIPASDKKKPYFDWILK